MSRLICFFAALLFFCSLNAQKEVYELRTYHLTFFKDHSILHNYLENALIPALNRQGIENVGVFEEMDERLPKQIFLLIPYTDIASFQESKDALAEDSEYQEDAMDYFKSSDKTPFTEISSQLIRSSRGFPNLLPPSEESGLFELRIYRSANEDDLRRKLKMFDDHEFPIFADAGLPMLFFGRNIVGDQMPCLTYMLATKDMDANKKGWGEFLNHPEWKRITQIEEFKNSMSDIVRVFLTPLSYSQI